MDVDTDADDGGRVDHAINTNLAVVAHEETAELQPRALEALAGIVPELDLAVVVLEVAGSGTAADIAPFADDSIAQEAVVSLIAVTDKDSVLDLATNLDVRPQGGRAIDLGADAHLGVMASGKASTDACALHHLDVGTDVDGAAVGVEHRTLDIGALLDKDAGGVADDSIGRRQRLRVATCRETVKILLQHRAVEFKDIIQVTHGEGDILGKMHMGIMTGIIVMGSAVEGDELLTHHQGLALLQGQHLFGKFRRGDDMSGYHEVGCAAHMQRELLLEVTHGEVTIGGIVTEHRLPLLANGGDTHAKQGRGTCIGKRHQVLTYLVVVKENDVACSLLHNSSLFLNRGAKVLVFLELCCF